MRARPIAGHAAPPPSPLAPVACLTASPTLAWQLAKREVQQRYRGSALGLLWSFATPLFLLAVFTFVFGVIFEARWDRDIADREDFALVLFAGLLVFWMVNDFLLQTPGLIRRYAPFVKKVVFPLELLPWTVMAGALFHAGVSVGVLLVAHLLVRGAPPWTALLLPVVLLPLVLLALGAGWALAALGAYLPDLDQLVGVALTGLLFLSTIFYPSSRAPEPLGQWLYVNPLSFPVDQTRAVLLWGELPAWEGLALYYVLGWGVAWLGFWGFQLTRKGFADVV